METSRSIFSGDELRVISLDSRGAKEGSEFVIMPHKLRLPSGVINPDESIEAAAQRIATETINQEGLKTHARLRPIDNLQAYVLEASADHPTDLRRGFAARAFRLDLLLKDADKFANTNKYDPNDIAFLQSYHDRTYQV